MINDKKILAIIPARGGSKGIPKKNIKLLNGLPLIAYTIISALKSSYIDELIVSTDDEEIANLSRKYGAYIPFLRPKELAQDTSTSEVVIIHALEWMELQEGKKFDLFVLLQPTSPFRNEKHIDESFEIFLMNKDVNTLYSVVEVKQSPYKMKKIDESGLLIGFMNNVRDIKQRQDNPRLYHPNGAIYISRTGVFKKLRGFDECNLVAYIMSEEVSIDIDTKFDFSLADVILTKLMK